MRNRHLRWLVATAAVCVAPLVVKGASSFARLEEVSPILAALARVVPPELQPGSSLDGTVWDRWVRAHDRSVRDRLAGGDEDTIVNWLLFGTSFTAEPRAVLDTAGSPERLPQIILTRIRDFVAALASPDRDERRLFAVGLLGAKGYMFGTAAERARVQQHLLAQTQRVSSEQQQYARELQAAQRSGDATEEFAARSKLFRDRGVSLDTSILPDFALERALETMRAQGLLAPNTIRRVAIVGPGLDFADKSSGYDFYPQQTLQPFAVIDSLARLGLSETPQAVELTAFDISERVNRHLKAAVAHSQSGSPYVINLPLDVGLSWTPELITFWRRAGDQIGVERSAPKPPNVGKQLEMRTLSVRPQVVRRIVPMDFNVVTERWSGAPFDLVIATNVLLYYDTLDQSLAAASIAAMLRPGGFFLSNNTLLELPAVPLQSAGYLAVRYSTAGDDGDYMVWYRRSF